jgi:hypothetical protein
MLAARAHGHDYLTGNRYSERLMISFMISLAPR